MAADYSGVAYWYHDEPHVPFPPLLDLNGRRLRFPWTNVSQWLVLASSRRTGRRALLDRYARRGIGP